MKKIIAILFIFAMCFSICACTKEDKEEPSITTAAEEDETVSYEPTVASVTEGIKNEFKDPESVQISDGCWAPVMEGEERSKTEFYIICTVRAKNSFGGYAEPQAYIIHYKYNNYRIVEEYNDYDFMMNKKLVELGCDVAQGLY